MKLVSRAAWGARSRSTSTNITPGNGGVTIHYVGASHINDSHSACAGRVKGIQNHHIDGNGWADIAYSLLVCQHGYVFVGRGLNRRTAANGTNSGNQNWYAVCALIGGSQQPSADMVQGIKDAVSYLRRSGGAASGVNGHRDHLSTSCPGNPLYAMVRNGTFGSGGSGGGGTRSMFDIQRAVNGLGCTPPLDVDGADGPKTQAGVRWLQRLVGASADGAWGPETERLYIVYTEDEVPIHGRYEKKKPQTLDRGDWVSLEFTERHDGKTGGIYSVVGVESEEKPAGFYDISVGVVLEDVTPGAEVQIRATEYESDGDGGWQIARNRPLHSPVHVGGKAHFVYAWKSHKAKGRRVRFRIAQFGDGPATITSATSEVFFFPKK